MFDGVSNALEALRTETGRLDNQRRAARKEFLKPVAAASARIPGCLRGVAAADLLSCNAQALRDHAGLLDELICEAARDNDASKYSFRGLLWASERPCCDPECPCMRCKILIKLVCFEALIFSHMLPILIVLFHYLSQGLARWHDGRLLSCLIVGI